MKTFQQFNEDIEQRRRELHQRSLDRIAAHKQRVADYKEAQKRKRQKEAEREEFKKEIKREMQA